MDTLATVGELENHLQRDVDQGYAEQALALASGAARAYCGWDLARETATLRVDGNGTSILSLPTLNLIDVHEIRINGVAVDMQYVHWSPRGQIFWWRGDPPTSTRWRGGWPEFGVIEADVDHGYDPIPDLIKLVVLDLAACRQSNPEGLASATVGQVSKSWSTGGGSSEYGLSELHAVLLDRYRIF